MKKLQLEIGKKFGKWRVIADIPEKKNNLTHWLCQCECARVDIVPLNNLMNGSSTQCRFCAADEIGKKKRSGAGLISGDMWSQFLASSKRKGIDVNIRVEEAWSLFVEQGAICGLSERYIELSGYPFDREKTTATLIRVDDESFTKENSIWVHKDVAKMIGGLSLDNFISYVKDIADAERRK